jgi:quercetin dioxygenase-like cupin family protein
MTPTRHGDMCLGSAESSGRKRRERLPINSNAIEKHAMKLSDQLPSTKAPEQVFTGDAWWNVIYAGEAPSRARLNHVRFAPGARTDWHSHVLGQTLHIVAGVALVGTRNGVVIKAHPGETVVCPPNEEHWHEATPDQSMEHLALWQTNSSDKPETTWLEPVSDSEYQAANGN